MKIEKKKSILYNSLRTEQSIITLSEKELLEKLGIEIPKNKYLIQITKNMKDKDIVIRLEVMEND